MPFVFVYGWVCDQRSSSQFHFRPLNWSGSACVYLR